MQEHVLWFESLGMNDVERVGGKNASLGEMISHLAAAGVQVPGGFATTAQAYWDFLDQSGLRDRINRELAGLDVDDVEALAATGERIRRLIVDTPFPEELREEITQAYRELEKRVGKAEMSVAVRSSATAEDLPDASFAGQQETFLNVRGLDNVLIAIKDVFASLFNDRAISYRVHKGFEHEKVALSAGIQEMVRSDVGASGVMFTMDTESGFRDVVFITASYGLGETVVQGAVNPDEFYVHKSTLEAERPAILRRNLGEKAIKMVYSGDQAHGRTVQTVEVEQADRLKFSLNDADVENLARQAVIIEKHYGRPMDIEWGKDGETGRLYILQARPETVKSQDAGQVLQRYHLNNRGRVITTGRAIGQRIGAGRARVVDSIKEMHRVEAGDVLITDMTDPDWEPIMKRAAAIVTNRGGRTCHAAIIARELGIPAVVGAGDATEKVKDGVEVTVSCAEGDTGYIYEGKQPFEVKEISLENMPDLPFKIMMNVGNPDRAFDFAHLPNAGIGLARLEFIINRMIGIHPRALLEFDQQSDDLKSIILGQIA
ncbi:MAG: phosphoenolpyruvate synthase, partial [Ectothiorhodospiraceae bacterium]